MKKLYVRCKNSKYHYLLNILNCEVCNKELRRPSSYKSKSNKILCKKCSQANRREENKIVGDEKLCKKCKIVQPIDNFYKEKAEGYIHYNGVCTRCYALNKYGINLAEYNEILKNQNEVCYICKNPENKKHRKSSKISSLAVDHNHNTGKIRGLLCNNCNRGLGLFNDNIDLLQEAINYLTKNSNGEPTQTNDDTKE